MGSQAPLTLTAGSARPGKTLWPSPLNGEEKPVKEPTLKDNKRGVITPDDLEIHRYIWQGHTLSAAHAAAQTVWAYAPLHGGSAGKKTRLLLWSTTIASPPQIRFLPTPLFTPHMFFIATSLSLGPKRT
jgi:hypothetical protein